MPNLAAAQDYSFWPSLFKPPNETSLIRLQPRKTLRNFDLAIRLRTGMPPDIPLSIMLIGQSGTADVKQVV
ncbi:hypothetical protein GCM10022398_14710 [Acetobacter lovaniensis]